MKKDFLIQRLYELAKQFRILRAYKILANTQIMQTSIIKINEIDETLRWPKQWQETKDAYLVCKKQGLFNLGHLTTKNMLTEILVSDFSKNEELLSKYTTEVKQLVNILASDYSEITIETLYNIDIDGFLEISDKGKKHEFPLTPEHNAQVVKEIEEKLQDYKDSLNPAYIKEANRLDTIFFNGIIIDEQKSDDFKSLEKDINTFFQKAQNLHEKKEYFISINIESSLKIKGEGLRLVKIQTNILLGEIEISKCKDNLNKNYEGVPKSLAQLKLTFESCCKILTAIINYCNDKKELIEFAEKIMTRYDDLQGTREKPLESSFNKQYVTPNSTDELYATDADDMDEISPDDVQQTQTGNCYFIASLSAIAKDEPNIIREAIFQEHNKKSFLVTFYIPKKEGGRRPIVIKVTNSFDSKGVKSGIDTNENELWVKVLEKALSILVEKLDLPGNTPYEKTERGFSLDAIELLAPPNNLIDESEPKYKTISKFTKSFNIKKLEAFLDQINIEGNPKQIKFLTATTGVVIDSPRPTIKMNTNSDSLVTVNMGTNIGCLYLSHTYMVESYKEKKIKLFNPHNKVITFTDPAKPNNIIEYLGGTTFELTMEEFLSYFARIDCMEKEKK